MLVLGCRFISQRSAFAVRAHRENWPAAVHIKPLSRSLAAGERWFEVSFQPSTCHFGPGFRRSKPCSVVLYRATARTPTVDSAGRNHVQSFCTARSRPVASSTFTCCDASQSGVRLVVDQSLVGRISAFAVRADCEAQPGPVLRNPLSRPPAALNRKCALSFQLESCCSDS